MLNYSLNVTDDIQTDINTVTLIPLLLLCQFFQYKAQTENNI